MWHEWQKAIFGMVMNPCSVYQHYHLSLIMQLSLASTQPLCWTLLLKAPCIAFVNLLLFICTRGRQVIEQPITNLKWVIATWCRWYHNDLWPTPVFVMTALSYSLDLRKNEAQVSERINSRDLQSNLGIMTNSIQASIDHFRSEKATDAGLHLRWCKINTQGRKENTWEFS